MNGLSILGFAGIFLVVVLLWGISMLREARSLRFMRTHEWTAEEKERILTAAAEGTATAMRAAKKIHPILTARHARLVVHDLESEAAEARRRAKRAKPGTRASRSIRDTDAKER